MADYIRDYDIFIEISLILSVKWQKLLRIPSHTKNSWLLYEIPAFFRAISNSRIIPGYPGIPSRLDTLYRK